MKGDSTFLTKFYPVPLHHWHRCVPREFQHQIFDTDNNNNNKTKEEETIDIEEEASIVKGNEQQKQQKRPRI